MQAAWKHVQSYDAPPPFQQWKPVSPETFFDKI